MRKLFENYKDLNNLHESWSGVTFNDLGKTQDIMYQCCANLLRDHDNLQGDAWAYPAEDTRPAWLADMAAIRGLQGGL